MDTELVFTRDASWYNSPQQDGRTVYHRDAGTGFAACSNRIVLNDSRGIEPSAVPASLLCKRCFRGATPDAG